jgi:hypothetical protein
MDNIFAGLAIEMTQGRLSIKTTCPVCGKIVDGYTCLDGEGKPSDGDFTLCVYCLTYLRFGFGLRLRIAKEKELKKELKPEQRDKLAKAVAFFRLSPLFRGGKEVH